MCQKVVHISDNYASIYASYELNTINNVTSNTDTLCFTLLAYAPEQYACDVVHVMSLHTTTVIYTQTSRYCTYKSNIPDVSAYLDNV